MLIPLASTYRWFNTGTFINFAFCLRLAAESRRLILQVLEDARGAHAAADAHGDEAVPGAAALHLVYQLHRELGAGGAHGVAERDGPAVDVGLVDVHADLAHHGEGLGRERLVELDEVYIVHREPGLLQHLRDGHHRPYAHAPGPDAPDGDPDEADEGREPTPLGLLPVHDDHGGGPVAPLRRVARGNGAVPLEGGPEFGELLGGGVARPSVAPEAGLRVPSLAVLVHPVVLYV